MHDLTVSGLYPDQLMLLADGKTVAQGSAEKVLTTETIRNHYGAEVEVLASPNGPIVVPIKKI